jgi:predicted alpha/beta superfamily hydrolase
MSNQPIPAIGLAEVHDLHSAAVGDDFHIYVADCGEDPQGVLLVADGNGFFGLAVDTVRLMQIPGLVPSLIVVAVGYPSASTLIDTAQIRARDLTPTQSSMFEQSGYADDFIRFLSDELRPWLNSNFPRAAGDVTYFGHSLGGLFGTYVLLTQPALFDRYILSSPSLWWDRELMFRIEQERSTTEDDLPTSAFFGIGSLETDEGRRAEAINLAPDHPFKPPSMHLDMVDDMRRFTAQLASRSYPTLDLQTAEIADEFHATVPGAVLSKALRHFWNQHPATNGSIDHRSKH